MNSRFSRSAGSRLESMKISKKLRVATNHISRTIIIHLAFLNNVHSNPLSGGWTDTLIALMLPCHCFFYTHICLHTYYLCNQCHLLDTYSWDNDYSSLEVSFFVFHFLLYCYSNGLELCISGSIGFSSSRLGNMGTWSWSDVILFR